MDAERIAKIRARYEAALAAKPSKGDYTEAGIAALEDSVCDIPTLIRALTQATMTADELIEWATSVLHLWLGRIGPVPPPSPGLHSVEGKDWVPFGTYTRVEDKK